MLSYIPCRFCSQIQEEGHQSRDHGFFKVHAKYLIEERFRGNLIEFNGGGGPCPYPV